MSRYLRAQLERAWQLQSRWLLLLLPLEVLFRGAVLVRRTLYAVGILKQFQAPVPVVVIGNISLGGTGKTPVVIALVEALQQRGVRVGVVARGYGRGGKGVHSVDRGSTAIDCGDEALMIFTRTKCPCVVARSRAHAVQVLLRTCAVDIVVCDDGLQHYGLARDLEVLMYDAQAAFGNGHCLPVGPLREPLSRLREVDLVLARGGGGPDSVALQADGLHRLSTGECRAVSPGQIGREVVAVAGIANPESFLLELRQAGFTLRERLFPDHHPYSAADFRAMDGRPVIMTEKDAVKCRALAGADAWYLQVNAVLPPALTSAVFALLDT